MTQSLFQKTQGLIELLAQDPLRAHVITHLSQSLGSTGEPVAIAFLQLSRDGSLHVVAHEGYADFDPTRVANLRIESDRAVSEALRSGRLRIFTLAERRGRTSDLPINLQEHWRSSVAIPIGLQSLYFLSFREDVTTIPDFEEFIRCVGSLLTTFEWHLSTKSKGQSDLWFGGKPEELSERESRILELIREGKTNPEIANEMGYSESLIRQETVSIYRKLGVSGRKEIKSANSMRNSKTSNPVRSLVDHSSSMAVRERSSST